MAKGKNEYFETFAVLTEMAGAAARKLQEILRDFHPDNIDDDMVLLHEIENGADLAKHAMMKKLAREFVTPIEREDIISLANEIDEVVDNIEDVLIRIYMYNIRTIREEALEFVDVIERCTTALYSAALEFQDFAKSKALQQYIVDVNTMEEEGDSIYIRAMRRLYTEENDPTEVVAWSEMFDRLELCCDSCEHAANVMESIVMKNS